MGARAQVLIADTGVFLYTHWGSGSIVNDVKDAINSDEGKSRQTDPEYLTRIIFSRLIVDDVLGETGFGIGTTEHGDIDLLVVVDCAAKTISFPGGELSFGEL